MARLYNPEIGKCGHGYALSLQQKPNPVNHLYDWKGQNIIHYPLASEEIQR